MIFSPITTAMQVETANFGHLNDDVAVIWFVESDGIPSGVVGHLRRSQDGHWLVTSHCQRESLHDFPGHVVRYSFERMQSVQRQWQTLSSMRSVEDAIGFRLARAELEHDIMRWWMEDGGARQETPVTFITHLRRGGGWRS